MPELFQFLVETNLANAAFIIGASSLFIAIVGHVKAFIEPTGSMRILLALFGLILMALSIGSYSLHKKNTSISLEPASTNLMPAHSQLTTTPVLENLPNPSDTLHANAQITEDNTKTLTDTLTIEVEEYKTKTLFNGDLFISVTSANSAPAYKNATIVIGSPGYSSKTFEDLSIGQPAVFQGHTQYDIRIASINAKGNWIPTPYVEMIVTKIEK